VREIRTLRAMWRGLQTELRSFLNGHEGGNPGYSQVVSYGPPRQRSTLPSTLRTTHPSAKPPVPKIQGRRTLRTVSVEPRSTNSAASGLVVRCPAAEVGGSSFRGRFVCGSDLVLTTHRSPAPLESSFSQVIWQNRQLRFATKPVRESLTLAVLVCDPPLSRLQSRAEGERFGSAARSATDESGNDARGGRETPWR
jgi:hypothetical protein